MILPWDEKDPIHLLLEKFRMFYHVLIETSENEGKKSSTKQLYHFDITNIKDVMDNVIIPYVRKEEIHFDGYFLARNDVRRLRVLATELESRVLAEREQAKVPPDILLMIRRSDVVQNDKLGNDLTKELLQKAREMAESQTATPPLSSNRVIVAKSQPTLPSNSGGRLRLFIGSSREGLAVAEALQGNLDHDMECTIWNQGVFGLSAANMESLEECLANSDFAVLAITPDDVIESRNMKTAGPRDNVIFELGLFMGALGRKRTFVVRPRKADIKMPSDLAGITSATYDDERMDGNLRAALGLACSDIKRAVQLVGARGAVPAISPR